MSKTLPLDLNGFERYLGLVNGDCWVGQGFNGNSSSWDEGRRTFKVTRVRNYNSSGFFKLFKRCGHGG